MCTTSSRGGHTIASGTFIKLVSATRLSLACYNNILIVEPKDPQVDPTEAHNTIQEVLWELESRVDAFHFPNYLDFLQTPVDGQIPQLADTKRNMAVNEHHNKLEELLSKLRGVKARGDEAVRRLRTDAIAQVEEELEELKRQKALVWYNVGCLL
jgi:hypothetical protein